MNNYKIFRWLAERKIPLDVGFAQSLSDLAAEYQRRNHIRRIDEVYKLIGIRRQLLFHWRMNPYSTQTKNDFKREVIKRAADLFEVNGERLANRAGLSLHIDKNFHTHLQDLIDRSHKSCHEIYTEAQISERVFYLIRRGRTPTKITLTAIAIVLNTDIDEILRRAGYVLSSSIAYDMVLKWLIERKYTIIDINNTLYNLDLPLLMVRNKKS
ncbi:MAG: lipid II flippase MurJ [Deferribacteraceae bacterium]|jgi:hypothetical protein|nr:lipid II flippase MurJ [Deferribacteraceae bacterium]